MQARVIRVERRLIEDECPNCSAGETDCDRESDGE